MPLGTAQQAATECAAYVANHWQPGVTNITTTAAATEKEGAAADVSEWTVTGTASLEVRYTDKDQQPIVLNLGTRAWTCLARYQGTQASYTLVGHPEVTAG